MIQQTAQPKTFSAKLSGNRLHDRPADATMGAVLALNRNFQALRIISVRRALCLIYKCHAEVINIEGGQYVAHDFESWREYSELKCLLGEEEGEDWISAVNFDLQVPRIVRLLQYDRLPRSHIKFNRRNVFLRDEYRCQYCRQQFSVKKLSLDHVVPRSRGGGTTWDNIVCACIDCNVRKGSRMPHEAHMSLLKKPTKPSRNPAIIRQLDDQRYHCWRVFLPRHAVNE